LTKRQIFVIAALRDLDGQAKKKNKTALNAQKLALALLDFRGGGGSSEKKFIISFLNLKM